MKLVLSAGILVGAGLLALGLAGCHEHREAVVVYQPGPAVVEQPEYVVVTQPPPPIIVEQQSPPPAVGYVWIGGFYDWDGHHYNWHRGEWNRPRGVWVGPRYEGPQHRYYPGHWSDDKRGGGPANRPGEHGQPSKGGQSGGRDNGGRR